MWPWHKVNMVFLKKVFAGTYATWGRAFSGFSRHCKKGKAWGSFTSIMYGWAVKVPRMNTDWTFFHGTFRSTCIHKKNRDSSLNATLYHSRSQSSLTLHHFKKPDTAVNCSEYYWITFITKIFISNWSCTREFAPSRQSSTSFLRLWSLVLLLHRFLAFSILYMMLYN